MQAPLAIWESVSLCLTQTLSSHPSLGVSSGMPKDKSSMGHLVPIGGKQRKVIYSFIIYFSVVQEHMGPRAGWLFEQTPSFLSFGPQLLDEILQMIIAGTWEGRRGEQHHLLLTGLKPSLYLPANPAVLILLLVPFLTFPTMSSTF